MIYLQQASGNTLITIPCKLENDKKTVYKRAFNIEVCIWSKCTKIVSAAVCAEMVETTLPMSLIQEMIELCTQSQSLGS